MPKTATQQCSAVKRSVAASGGISNLGTFWSPRKEFIMAQRAHLGEISQPLHEAYAYLLANGLDGTSEALHILVNEASRIERAQQLQASLDEFFGTFFVGVPNIQTLSLTGLHPLS
jgi:hypothetical protein